MRKVILILYLLINIDIFAQEQNLKLSGKVEISIVQGTIEADLTLSNIPPIKDYYIRLNAGLNILNFRNSQLNNDLIRYSVSQNDTLSYGATKAYFFTDKKSNGKFLPNSFQVKYVGKFPVVKDTIENYSAFDWRGNIAFNHNSIRAEGLAGSWYPVLYDVINDKIYQNVIYDLEINCNDCSSLYINGSVPIKAQKQNFKSDIAQELTLFCGKYDFSNLNETYLLNSKFNKEQIKGFSEIVNSYKNYFSKKLQILYDKPVTFIETTPTAKKTGFLYVSFPTITSINWEGNGLSEMLNPNTQNRFRPFIAHEIGHYYFGSYKVFNSELGDMLTEGFAEFLSFEVTNDLLGKDIYTKKINDKVKALEGFKAIPIGAIKSNSDYGNRELYVYYYAPIIFTAIKKEIGEENMWKWLNCILNTKATFTNYDYLISTLKKVISDGKKVEYIEQEFLKNENSLNNAIKKISLE